MYRAVVYVIPPEREYVCDDPAWIKRLSIHGAPILLRDFNRICPVCLDVARWILNGQCGPAAPSNRGPSETEEWVNPVWRCRFWKEYGCGFALCSKASVPIGVRDNDSEEEGQPGLE